MKARLRNHISGRTRLAVLTLAWLLIAPIAVLAPTTAADAAVIEPTELSFGERVTSPSSPDSVSRAASTGLVLMLQDDGSGFSCELWPEQPHCSSSGSSDDTPPPPPPPDPYVEEAQARAQAITELNSLIPDPDFEMWPNEGQLQAVNLDSFLHVTSGADTITTSSTVGSVTVWVEAVPDESVWTFTETDGDRRTTSFTCDDTEPWTPGDDDPLCGKKWLNSSDVTGDVDMEMFIRYDATWSSRLTPSTVFSVNAPEPVEASVTVAEVLTHGGSLVPPVPDNSGGSGGDGGFCNSFGIFSRGVCYIGDKAKDAALAALYAVAPWLEEVFNFFEGCGDAVMDQLGGIVDILGQIKDAVTDPGKFIDEKLAMIKEMWEAAQADPAGFALQMLGSVTDLEYLSEEGKVQWAGKMVCSLAIEYLSGKAIAGVAQKLEDFIGRRRDRDGNLCPISSFPGDTLVMMGSGDHKRIDAIRPGDVVLSYDIANSTWEPNVVLDQWSHLDDGPAATVTLADDSTVTATDDHLFWVNSTSEWTQLQHVARGALLLSTAGEVVVDHVAVSPARDWTVWELTVEDNHNFTVSTGSHDLLVHNCRPKKDTDELQPDHKQDLSDAELAHLTDFLKTRQRLLEKWHDFDWDSLLPGNTNPQNLRRQLEKAENSIDGDLDASDLAGATKEARGVPSVDRDGNSRDHIDSRDRGLTSVSNAIEAIETQLRNPGNLSPDATAALTDKLSDLQTVLDGVRTATVPIAP